MSSFAVENAVPMPGRRNRYPFESMQSGQSFEIRGEDESRKVRNAAYQFAKKVNDALEKAKADHAAAVAAGTATGELDLPAEVKFALRKTGEEPVHNEDGSPKTDTEGKQVTLKIYRIWRE